MLKGAALILVPNACPMEINRLSQLRARAFENMTAIATCNYPVLSLIATAIQQSLTEWPICQVKEVPETHAYFGPANKKVYISVSLIWQCCVITARMKCLAMLIVIRKNMAF